MTIEQLKGKIKKQTVFTLNWHVFENIVKQVYGVSEYDFVADIECNNDSCHQYHVYKKEDLDEYDEEQLHKFIREGQYGNLAYTIFEDLVNKDILEPGTYVVEVSW